MQKKNADTELASKILTVSAQILARQVVLVNLAREFKTEHLEDQGIVTEELTIRAWNHSHVNRAHPHLDIQ